MRTVDVRDLSTQIVEMEGPPGQQWARIPLPLLLLYLAEYIPNLMTAALEHTAASARARAAGVLISPASGSLFAQLPALNSGRALALLLLYDTISTARNALGRAAASTRKYAVVAVRVTNVPALQRLQRFILPVAIISHSTLARIGIDAVVRSLQPDFERAANGMYSRGRWVHESTDTAVYLDS
jgi:hypothetical protein